MTSLTERRKLIDLKFLHKIVNGLSYRVYNIDYPDLLILIFLNVKLVPQKCFTLHFKGQIMHFFGL